MRIIPDGFEAIEKSITVAATHEIKWIHFFMEGDTIEITDAEWDEISHQYAIRGYDKATATWGYTEPKPFSQYLRDLISLTGEGR
jgi:hypothetical protein